MENTINIKRDLYEDLLKWKNRKNRKPLLLQGARQVGKTWLLKHFGSEEFKEIAYYNFDEQPELQQFFEITKKPERIIANLETVNDNPIKPYETLIIFDEIQESNQALNSLKYFKENAPEYAIIGSGSLLGIKLSANKSFPVGQVDFLTLNPVTFKEFIAEIEPSLYNYLSKINEIAAIPDLFFNHLTEKLRLYFITGGMPEAIKALLNGNKNVTEIQKAIINAYYLDFSKHIKAADIPKIHYIWKSLPAQLSKENKKFLYQTIRTGARAREYENALMWLEQAGLIHIVNKITKPGLPLSAYLDLSAFKVYLLDVGLLRQMSGLHPDIIKHGNILFSEFKGAFAENFILQSLITQFDSVPNYWTSNNKAEVDFVLQYKNKIIPIEVKAETNIKSKSLMAYNEKYSPEIMIRYSLKNFGYQNKILNIPLFFADYTRKILDMFFP